MKVGRYKLRAVTQKLYYKFKKIGTYDFHENTRKICNLVLILLGTILKYL